MPRRRQQGIGLGIMFLLHKLYSTGLGNIPSVTLLAIIGQCFLFMGIVNPPWDRYDVCVSGESILLYHDYKRLFLSAIEHADDFHLYYNMASLILKGRTLEKRYGSVKFLILLVVFTIATNLTYVGLVWLASELLESYSYMKQCAIGFSGVLFALKVLTTHYEGTDTRYVHGIIVPAKYAVWAELVVIQILVPRASFIGHLAGILVGLVYVMGPLKYLINTIYWSVPGFSASLGASYTYHHGTTGTASHPGMPQQSYGWNINDGSQYQSEQVSQSNQLYDYGKRDRSKELL
ncbi:Rhomboid-related protein 4-like [Homarus americanus]|uniref:Rhomboid-related protein 4-like n=1 Tax=Homarus americanus TaxID=6706 RepID=A0A8J5MKF7_HOMAM|nr:Rhomboid-related protein 4-like [Homarus americanus]